MPRGKIKKEDLKELVKKVKDEKEEKKTPRERAEEELKDMDSKDTIKDDGGIETNGETQTDKLEDTKPTDTKETIPINPLCDDALYRNEVLVRMDFQNQQLFRIANSIGNFLGEEKPDEK